MVAVAPKGSDSSDHGHGHLPTVEEQSHHHTSTPATAGSNHAKVAHHLRRPSNDQSAIAGLSNPSVDPQLNKSKKSAKKRHVEQE
ncbi:uncharacterized protein BT62DRAFT_165310 [Guyanagaster necrorhizus]|uniref:Uncharacterized protein n=1 Tax=Guyanagaster necrorhizus TaxID=856835 RepID=A0A9P7VTD1_9AGAR|nr:uncharacterized protein BT62DRAFT_165310 [Guyanagaster necrorhizus MCA 3950]KAG7445586.1 hypothetical protein BT62DRAFT_165310 [Guyanagaster necrorhizus MCA 3950]